MGRLKGGELLIDATELGDITQLNVGGSTGVLDISHLFNIHMKLEPEEYYFDIQKKVDELLFNKQLVVKVKVGDNKRIVYINKVNQSIYTDDIQLYHFTIAHTGNFIAKIGNVVGESPVELQIELNSVDE